ncbi:MAG: 6-carboxytetrahydropterin synthase [Actinomycetota bacterium]|nr:6-carboxytetrahydropterin synthase [Actinomycetota bacterium]
MRLTMTAAVTARWGHRVGGLIHTHAWSVEATVEGPLDAPMVFPADDLEEELTEAVRPWERHYLTHEDVGEWKGYAPIVWDREPTVEEITRRLWHRLSERVPGLVSLALVESTEFDRCRTVRVTAA